MWKDFFRFTRLERRAAIVILFLIIIVLVSIQMINHSSKNDNCVSLDAVMTSEEYASFEQQINSLRKRDREVTYGDIFSHKADNYNSNSKRHYSAFNPNTATKQELINAGLSNFSANNIIKYREKGGRFRAKKDVAKIYGIDSVMFSVMSDYIVIDKDKTQENKTQSRTERPSFERKIYLHKLPKGTVVDINNADTVLLKQVPNIGSYRAKKIVKYREQLGGYTDINQLNEIEIDSDLFTEWFVIDTASVRRINANTATLKEMIKHPYLQYHQAKIIEKHRRKYGKIVSISQLKMYSEFTSEDIDRLCKYLSF